jgi:adenylate cyclase
VVFREIDRVKVKGKEEAISIYEPLGLESDSGELRLWEAALRAYRARAWDEAEVKLRDLQRMNGACELYRGYAQRVSEKRRSPPPPDWDGVSVFDEK